MSNLADAHRDWHTAHGWDQVCPLDCGAGEAAAAEYDLFAVGDVVEDPYGNPAVVIGVDVHGDPCSVIQTCGSDRGRVSSPGAIIRRVAGTRADWARDVARQEWRSNPVRYRNV